jgi:choline/glycine/proline betaine transport protein
MSKKIMEDKKQQNTSQQETQAKKSPLIKKLFDIHGPVFWPTAILLVIFISITIIVGEPMEKVFNGIQNWISTNFGWFLVLVVNFFLFFILFIAFTKYGKIKLGGKNAVPEFSRGAWFAMLFSAGMGIGILFWSVAEPIFHFTSPPVGEGQTTEAAKEAMRTTFLHWGLHAWAIYSLVGLALAFFSFNRNMPLAIRSVFYPMLGDKVYRWPGDVIDVLAVLATLFGLATSLGLGVKQVSAGLGHLFNINDSLQTQVILIIAITLAATASVVSGLDQGVKKLSQLNINIGAVLLAFIIIIGPTIFILDSFTQNIGNYVSHFFEKSFWTETYKQSDWQNQWTIFYWSWWISWSPFVGMFIARISKGRSVKEYVLSVLIVPTILTFLWISAFGGSAMFLELKGVGGVAESVKENVATAIYQLFENFPLSQVTNFAAIVLVISFFVTSSDSGSLVVDAFTSGGKLKSPVGQRVFWALMEGTVAAILLVGGGLNALQTAAITTGLPFAIILIIMAFSLRKGLQKEHEKEELREKAKERESYKELIMKLVSKNNHSSKNHKDSDYEEKR